MNLRAFIPGIDLQKTWKNLEKPGMRQVKLSVNHDVEWLGANYQGSKLLYLGISPHAFRVTAGHVSHFHQLDCTHEEADDRMMFHIQDILSLTGQDQHP